MKAIRIAKKVTFNLPPTIRALIYNIVRGEKTVDVLSEEEKKGVIFIHIPKNAGVSVSEALFGRRVGHRSVKKLKIQHPYKFKNLTTFAIKRNPYDRILSAYSFLKKGGMNKHDEKWSRQNLQRFDSFEEFVHSLSDEDQKNSILSQKHFAEQVYWVGGYSGKIEVDALLKFEKLKEDLKSFARENRINVSLPHKNSSNHASHRKVYTKKMREIVSEIYEADFKVLDYDNKL